MPCVCPTFRVLNSRPSFVSYQFMKVVEKLSARVEGIKTEKDEALAALLSHGEAMTKFMADAQSACNRLQARLKVEYKEIRAKVRAS